MKQILIADDHRMFADGISSLIADQDQFQICHIADNGVDALNYIRENPVDIAILDINMPKMDGIELTKALREQHPEVHILILTMHEEYHFVAQILEAEANGYLLKNTGKKELVEALDRVADGGNYFGQEMMLRYLQQIQREMKKLQEEPPVKLTRRETETLHCICQELTTQEIADTLYISTHTVETHRKNLLSKTGARNSAGLVKFAIRNGHFTEE